MFAAGAGAYEQVQCLIGRRADLCIKNTDGRTALDLASGKIQDGTKSGGHKTIRNLLHYAMDYQGLKHEIRQQKKSSATRRNALPNAKRRARHEDRGREPWMDGRCGRRE